MEQKCKTFHRFSTWRLTQSPINQPIAGKTFQLSRSSQCTICERTFTKFVRCSACHNVRYCSQICQRKDWNRHQLGCKVSRQLNTVNTASLILPEITSTAYNNEKWQEFQHDIEYLILFKNIHPNYIFIETQITIKSLETKPNRRSLDFSHHFLHFLLGEKASKPMIIFLKFICDLGFRPHPESYNDPYYFDPLVFTILHQIGDLIFRRGYYWNTVEIANGYIGFFSWIQGKTIQFPLDKFFDSDNLLALVRNSNKSLESCRALSWMIRFKGKENLEFLFSVGNYSINQKLSFKSEWKKMEAYVEHESKQRVEILRSELKFCFFYISDLVLLCEKYLPECWDCYVQRIQ